MGFSLGGMFKGIGHTVGSIGKGIVSVPGKVISGGMGLDGSFANVSVQRPSQQGLPAT